MMVIIFKILVVFMIVLGYLQFWVIDDFVLKSWYLPLKRILFVVMGIGVGLLITVLFIIMINDLFVI